MLLIKNAKVYTLENDEVLENADILCENGKIAKIGENIVCPEAEVIDAAGMVCTPGLIDAHVHIGGFDGADQDLNETTDPVTPEMDALYAIDIKAYDFKELAKNGVTCACFVPGSSNVIGGTGFVAKTAGKNDIRELAIVHPAVMKCAMGGNPKYYGNRGKSPMTRMGVANVLRGALLKAKTYMEKKEAAGDDASRMPAYDVKSEALIPVLQGKMPLKVHSEQFDMLTVIEIAKEFGCEYTIEHGWASDLYIDELAAGGGPVNFGPIGVAEGYGELTGGDIALVKQMDERGINVSIITDGPVYGPQTLLISAGEAVRCGTPHDRALRMVTANPAKTLKVENRVGSIKVGKDADLVLWNAVPALDTCAHPLFTVIEGKVVYKK